MRIGHAQHPSLSSRYPDDIHSTAASVTVNKCALSFILGSSSLYGLQQQAPLLPSTPRPLGKRARTDSSSCTMARKTLCLDHSASSPQVSTNPTANSSAVVFKKSSRLCEVDGCMSRAKLVKRCWRHGGSIKCRVSDCRNRAKTKGVCWSHGGGTFCSYGNCGTISVSNGFCWAHGGGKRCLVDKCFKPAYERTQNFCERHFHDKRTGVNIRHDTQNDADAKPRDSM